jgi:hypothetical protein
MVPSELIINEMNAFDEDGTMVAPDPVLTASQVSSQQKKQLWRFWKPYQKRGNDRNRKYK